MREARLFKDGVEPILVKADDVLSGIYRKDEYEFVDPEYNFKVGFVKDSKGHGGPYFRFYYSYEDYKKLFPDRADRYEIVANMRKYQESQWHLDWKEKCKTFCETEKYFKNIETKQYKYADAYYKEGNTVIEFQHSYIAFDFEERNKFYSVLNINIVWLYDLPKANITLNSDGFFEILEDNARGFFRISENPQSLKDYPVFIEVKDGKIYRIDELNRKKVDGELRSTIRHFKPIGIYTKEEFIQSIIKGDRVFMSDEYKEKNGLNCYTIYQLWNKEYSCMVVEDTEKKEDNTILITGTKAGDIFQDLDNGCIKYRYVTWLGGSYLQKNMKNYPLSYKDAYSRKWKLLGKFIRK